MIVAKSPNMMVPDGAEVTIVETLENGRVAFVYKDMWFGYYHISVLQESV